MPGNDLLLRTFRLADAAIVARWLRGPGLGLPPGVAGRKWAERLLADPRVQAWVAVQGEVPVGFSRLDVGPDRVAELTLAVAANRRRQGVGTAVLQAVLAAAAHQRLRRIHAVVDRDNAAAMWFFAENGFEDIAAGAGSARFVRWLHGRNREELVIEVN
jgi:L-amino acid N-acyltransferase YncA